MSGNYLTSDQIAALIHERLSEFALENHCEVCAAVQQAIRDIFEATPGVPALDQVRVINPPANSEVEALRTRLEYIRGLTRFANITTISVAELQRRLDEPLGYGINA